ncbi:hypothetical protein AMS68_002517 [Peltaster fructicola]|uniref:Amine oxidase n=1 Tax=Peltaster fructicola TaxID=286661 RepID=A0A6H0XRA7_9PEZI|nr:hypothetical protein AMS68_002517 [Peltaster fructicola]
MAIQAVSRAPSKRWLLFTAFVLLLCLIVYLSTPLLKTSEARQADVVTAFNAPKRNIWADLSEDEAAEVTSFLFKHFAPLNLTHHPHNSRDNYINTIEVLRPNKTDAASYLYDGGDLVARYAKVSLNEHHAEGPRIVYYMVGPLPVSSDTAVDELSYIFNSGTNWVRNPVYDFVAIQEFGLAIGENISDITQDLIGARVNRDDPLDSHGLLAFPRASRIDAGGLILWMQFYRPGFGSSSRTLLPQGIYARVDARSPDVSDWAVGEYYYNGVLYGNADEFRTAIDGPDFEKTPPNLDGPWTDTEDFTATPSGREMPPPVMIQPYGSRFKLDRHERFVSWFGFEFYIGTARATGISLFDIRFRGERVMYELGLQEAMAHYAGDDPMQGGLEFMDAFFGMGKNAFELVPGYDCPAYAEYLDSAYHDVRGTIKTPNNLCIFEYTADHPLSRHTMQYAVTVSRNTYLTVRSVSTVGNYDYQIDYVFYMDGTIEVKVRASGFIFATFYTNNQNKQEDEYGHRIHDALSSSMHDHVINFKADLDIAGGKNDMVRLALEPITTSYAWDQPEVKKRNTMHLVEYSVDEESGLDWPKNSAEFYIAYSREKKNAWGERKGYRITSGTGMGSTPHLTILNSSTLGESARWAEHDLWILRRKDTEPASADPLNFLEPKDPIVAFSRLADHESLDPDDYDGDLVVYFNLGAHHIPHSGDVPNTLMHTSASSVMFVPHNFADRDPSRESVQGVRVQLNGKKRGGGFAGESTHSDMRSREAREPVAHYFGATYEKGLKLSLEAIEPDLSQYRTTVHAVTDLQFNGTAAGIWHKQAE